MNHGSRRWVAIYFFVVMAIVGLGPVGDLERPISFRVEDVMAQDGAAGGREPDSTLVKFFRTPVGQHLGKVGTGLESLALAYGLAMLATFVFAVFAEQLSVDETFFGEEFPDLIKAVFNLIGSAYLVLAAIRIGAGHPIAEVNILGVLVDLNDIVCGGIVVLAFVALLGRGVLRYRKAETRIRDVIQIHGSQHPGLFRTLVSDDGQLLAKHERLQRDYKELREIAIGFLPRSLLLIAFTKQLLTGEVSTILVLGLFLISGAYAWVGAIKLASGGTASSAPKGSYLVLKAYVSLNSIGWYLGVYLSGYVVFSILPEIEQPIKIAAAVMLVIAAFVVGFGGAALGRAVMSLVTTIAVVIAVPRLVRPALEVLGVNLQIHAFVEYSIQLGMALSVRMLAGALVWSEIANQRLRAVWGEYLGSVGRAVRRPLGAEVVKGLADIGICIPRDHCSMAMRLERKETLWTTVIGGVEVPVTLLWSGMDVYKEVGLARYIGVGRRVDIAIVDARTAVLMVGQYGYKALALVSRGGEWSQIAGAAVAGGGEAAMARTGLPGSEPTPHEYSWYQLEQAGLPGKSVHVVPSKMQRVLMGGLLDNCIVPEPYASSMLVDWGRTGQETAMLDVSDRAGWIKELGAAVVVGRRGFVGGHEAELKQVLGEVHRNIIRLERIGRGVVDRPMLDELAKPYETLEGGMEPAAIQRAVMKIEFVPQSFGSASNLRQVLDGAAALTEGKVALRDTDIDTRISAEIVRKAETEKCLSNAIAVSVVGSEWTVGNVDGSKIEVRTTDQQRRAVVRVEAVQ